MEELKSADPATGMRCMAIWLRSVKLDPQAEDAEAYAKDTETLIAALKRSHETVRSQAATIEHLQELLWRIQPILNPGCEIALKVEKVVGSVHTNGDRFEATR